MDDSGIRAADCGRRAGTNLQTPRRVANAPGLASVAYRTGTHASFKESLLARLANTAHPALAGLGTRADRDLTIALCDTLAVMLDVLTFYQERLVNEHFLRTATELRSVRGLARLIGYTPAPGVAASTWLAFTLQQTPGSAAARTAPIEIPAGTRVQSVPGQGEEPHSFETVAATAARVEWNAMPAETRVPWRPRFGDTELWLAGVSTRLEPGDAILLVGNERAAVDTGSERWDVRFVHEVEVDRENDCTRVAWDGGLGHVKPHVEPAGAGVEVHVFRQRAALFGHNAPDPRLMQTEGTRLASDMLDEAGTDWKDFAITTSHVDLDAAYPKITTGSWFALVSGEARLGRAVLPGYVELYRVEKARQVSRRDFGLSAKITRLVPDTSEHLSPSVFKIRETLVLGQSEILPTVARPVREPLYGDELVLGATVDGLAPGQALAVTGKRQHLAVAPAVNDLVLDLDEGGTAALAEGDRLALVAAPVQMGHGTLESLAPAAFGAALGRANVRLRLEVEDRDGRRGRLLARAHEVRLDASDAGDPAVSEIALIATDDQAVQAGGGRTRLALAAPLANCYERATVRLNANVAAATEGETVQEILGDGDASRTDARFPLRQSPLTFLSAGTASGRASSVQVRVNDLLWTEVPTLYERGPDERVFTLAIDENAAAVCFGDGCEGARPPSGQNNVRITYRKGLGAGGNVGADRLTTLLSRPLGVSSATNPAPAAGGEDPEPTAQARANAPLNVLTLDRAVSLADYADFARAFAGIAKAHALWVPAGPARGVFLTVAGADGAPLPDAGATLRNLRAALANCGDPLLPVRVVDYRPAVFCLGLAVKVAAEHARDRVLAALKAALRDRFGFGARSFGQGISLDEVLAAAHGLVGIRAVRATALYRPHPAAEPSVQPRLKAALPVASLVRTPLAAELLTLDEPSLALEVLS